MDKYIFGEDRSEGRLTMAWRALEKARELEPDHPSYHLSPARWYFKIKNDYQLAEEEYLLAGRRRPGDWGIFNNLCFVMQYQEKFGRALMYMERCATLMPKEAQVQTNVQYFLGRLYNRCQRYADAERALRRAMALDPEGKDLRPYSHWAKSALGYQFEGYERSIDAHIKNIRFKLEDDP